MLEKKIHNYQDSHFKSTDWPKHLGVSNKTALDQINLLRRKLNFRSLAQRFIRFLLWIAVFIFFVSFFWAATRSTFIVFNWLLPTFTLAVSLAGFHYNLNGHLHQTDLINILPKDPHEEVCLFLDYWNNFLASEAHVYKNNGVKGLGTIVDPNLFLSSYGVLALIGHKSSRSQIDIAFFDFNGEWWFPKPSEFSKVKLDTTSSNANSSNKKVLWELIHHAEPEETQVLLKNLRSHIFNDKNNKIDKNKRLRIVYIIEATIKFRQTTDPIKRYDKVMHELKKNEIDTLENSPIDKISKHSKYQSAEKFIRIYIAEKEFEDSILMRKLQQIVHESS